jgi:hypothetical protein
MESLTGILTAELQRSKDSNQRMEDKVLLLRSLLREAAGWLDPRDDLTIRIRAEVGR